MPIVSEETASYLNDLVSEGDVDWKVRKVLQSEFARRLSRYKYTIRRFEKKYGMDFEEFKRKEMVKRLNYSFEVESDFCDWEMAIDGVETMESRLCRLRAQNENR